MSGALNDLAQRVESCERCPRLVEWREQVGLEKRAAYRDQVYWAKPVPSFGDPQARVVLTGLAPGAHGANRTGRMFTGDRSGDFLYPALHRVGLANQPGSQFRGDGLKLSGCYITAAVHCVPPENKPSTEERDNCLPFLKEELLLLPHAKSIVCLGQFAWDATLRAVTSVPPRPKPKFGHATEWETERFTLIGCYHPSQQNTFTGKLTEQMIDTVLLRAIEVASQRYPG